MPQRSCRDLESRILRTSMFACKAMMINAISLTLSFRLSSTSEGGGEGFKSNGTPRDLRSPNVVSLTISNSFISLNSFIFKLSLSGPKVLVEIPRGVSNFNSRSIYLAHKFFISQENFKFFSAYETSSSEALTFFSDKLLQVTLLLNCPKMTESST